MAEFLYIVIGIAKGIAAWIVPFAVVAYVVTYFVMAIIFVSFWKQERGPWLGEVLKSRSRLRQLSRR